ncbi:MAG: hypothetical protein R3330_15080 [Saprospiraceae bacterium]|nr:hypothetical protein [Saprospiraceae bacterium]
MTQLPVHTFAQFIGRFPEVELPVTLTDESISGFQQNSSPLSASMVTQFIVQDPDAEGEYVEYVPCFRIPETHGFHAVVLWRGDLMKYHYLLVTYDKKGNMIGSATIAGLESDGASILRSVTTIDEEWILHIVEGEHDPDEELYTPTKSRAYRMELLATGEIIFLLDEMEGPEEV